MRNKLIEARVSSGLRQEDVAVMLKTSQQTISLVETGRRDPSLQLAKKFEVLYKTPMEDLFPDIFLKIQTTNCNVTRESTERRV